MNREQRRQFNKTHKTNFTREQFSVLVAQQRIKNNIFDFSDLSLPKDFVHLDNEIIAPEGCVVKLNAEAMRSRPTQDLTEDFLEFVNNNKDKELHLTRKGAENSLVCIEEDKRTKEIDGKTFEAPKFLFDLYTDLYIQYEGSWYTAVELENIIPNPSDSTEEEEDVEVVKGDSVE